MLTSLQLTVILMWLRCFRSTSRCSILRMPQVRPHITPEATPVKPGAIPPSKPAFRISVKKRLVLDEYVADQISKGWVNVSTSNYGAPVLFVPKSDGTLRMCIDYRALSKITERTTYPLPRIDDLMDNLSGAKFFSSLDMTSGYHQLVLRESDRPKTAFNTRFGKFEYKVLPMGLCNEPAVFQSAMNSVFGSLLNRHVCIYLDDMLIFSNTRAEHLQHLEAVLRILHDADLKAKRKKCELFNPELKIWGQFLSRACVLTQRRWRRWLTGPHLSACMKSAVFWV